MSALLAACSGLAPSGGPAGGSLDAPAVPAGAPTAAQPSGGDENSEGASVAYNQAPGFPAGNPGPDVTPEDKKFHFYVFPKFEEFEQEILAGPVEAKLKGLHVSGTLQCQGALQTSQLCAEGLVLRIVDFKRMKFVETKIEAETEGHFAFQANFPGSAQPEGSGNFEHWAFYLNYSPSYAPAALQSLQDCPEPGQGASNFTCLPFSIYRTTWGVGMPFESGS